MVKSAKDQCQQMSGEMVKNLKVIHAVELQRLPTKKAIEAANWAKAQYYELLVEEKRKEADKEDKIQGFQLREALAKAELAELQLQDKKMSSF